MLSMVASLNSMSNQFTIFSPPVVKEQVNNRLDQSLRLNILLFCDVLELINRILHFRWILLLQVVTGQLKERREN